MSEEAVTSETSETSKASEQATKEDQLWLFSYEYAHQTSPKPLYFHMLYATTLADAEQQVAAWLARQAEEHWATIIPVDLQPRPQGLRTGFNYFPPTSPPHSS